MKFYSIVKKAYKLIEKMQLSKNRAYNNCYFIGNKPSGSKVVLFLKNPEYMHFGDHFFFEPLVRYLIDKGYDVKVMPTKGMEFYFRKCGYNIGCEKDLEKADLIITRFEMVDEVRQYKSIIAIDTASLEIREVLCKDIIDKIARILEKDSTGFDFRPATIKAETAEIKIDVDKKYVIFNNYIDSGAYRVTNLMKNSLLKFAERYAKENNYIIIHTGTQKEKERDKNSYSKNWIDLRGKTKPEDLFWLAEQPNIVANISFDAFGMHLFFIYGKKNFIKFRGRFTKKGADFILKYVNPPFPVTGDKSELIEYI